MNPNKTTPKTDISAFKTATRKVYTDTIKGTAAAVRLYMTITGIDDGQTPLGNALKNFNQIVSQDGTRTLDVVIADSYMATAQLQASLGFVHDDRETTPIKTPMALLDLLEENHAEIAVLIETAQWGGHNQHLRMACESKLAQFKAMIDVIRSTDEVSIVMLTALVSIPVSFYTDFHIAMMIRNVETMETETTTENVLDHGTKAMDETADETVREPVLAGNNTEK